MTFRAGRVERIGGTHVGWIIPNVPIEAILAAFRGLWSLVLRPTERMVNHSRTGLGFDYASF